MSLIYNGTTVTSVTYGGGGNNVKHISWNGVNVFTQQPSYIAFLNSSTISESDFLNKVCVTDTFNDINTSTNLPYAKDFIGKTITGISNNYDGSINTQWEIIDYNHIDDPTGENTAAEYTFDLIAKKTIKDGKIFRYSAASKYNQNYEYSEIRTWLQSYVNNFSTTNSTLYNHLYTMDVVYNFNTKQQSSSVDPSNSYYNDTNTNTTGSNKHTIPGKIKLLSCTELGYTSGISYMPYNEGTIYSNKFSSKDTLATDSSMIWYSGSTNSKINWWTRTRRAESGNTGDIWGMWSGGYLGDFPTDNSLSVVPVIRVKVLFGDYRDYQSDSAISISDFLDNVVNNSNVFTDNQASQFIGKTITGITNTYDSAYNVDWEIIDYNHDSTTNTFDLIAKKSVKDSMMFRNYGGGSGSYTYNQNYEYSEIRTWLQSYVDNFSSPLSTKLATMDIVYNFNTNQPDNRNYIDSSGDSDYNTGGTHKHTITDKIKLLSCTELGYSSTVGNTMPMYEGNIYSNKFNSFSANVADSNRIRNNTSGSATTWWLRSRYVHSSYGYYAWTVYTDGKLKDDSIISTRSVVPVIRISV